MAIKIGHASISENGSVNGAAGDQTGREVCTRTWYSKPWSLVLRCKDPATAERMARACEKGCANNNIGYSQADRNSAHAQAHKVGYDLAKITSRCNTDCSAFMTLCAIAAGVSSLEYTGNAPTTSNMRARFAATGKFDVLTDKKYLTSDAHLKRGDILVKPGSHTVMALQNGSKASVSAVKPAASAPAKQPEIKAAEAKPTEKEKKREDVYMFEVPILGGGMKGNAVLLWQKLLAGCGYDLGEDGRAGNLSGEFNAGTYLATLDYKKHVGITIGEDGTDGRVTPETWAAMLGI